MMDLLCPCFMWGPLRDACQFCNKAPVMCFVVEKGSGEKQDGRSTKYLRKLFFFGGGWAPMFEKALAWQGLEKQKGVGWSRATEVPDKGVWRIL